MDVQKKTKTLLAAWVTCMAVAGEVNAIECPPGSQQAECLEQEKARQQSKQNAQSQPSEKQPQPVEPQRQPTEQNTQREQHEKQQQIEQQRQQRAVMEQQQREQLEKQQHIEQQRQQRAVMEQQQREQLEKQQQIEQQRQQRAVMEQQQREQLEKQKHLELQRQQNEQQDKQQQAEAQQKLLEQQQREQQNRQQQVEQQQKLLEQQQREQRDKRHQTEIQQKLLEQQQREQRDKRHQAEMQQKLLEQQQREQQDKQQQAEQQQKLLEQQQREQRDKRHQAELQQKLLEQQQREQLERQQQAEQQQKQLEQQQTEPREKHHPREQQRQQREQREKQRQAEQQHEHEKQLQIEQSRRQREHSEKQNQFDEQRQTHQPAQERDRHRDKRAQQELEGTIQPAPNASSKPESHFGTLLPNSGHRPFEPSLLTEHHHENRTPAHAIVINQNTQAFKDDSGYTIQHQATEDSKVVFKNKRLPDGQTLTYGYKQTRHDKDNGWTRTYLDGRRISAGPKFVKRSDPSRHFSVITHHNGLREGFTHSGRPAFREFFTETHHHHRREKVVQRTINVTTINNTVVFLNKPIIQNYAIVTFGGSTVFSYYPASRNRNDYSLFDRSISLTVTPKCLICPPPVIIYEQPIVFYSDPVELLSDMTLATSLYEGMRPAPSESQQEEIKLLQNQVDDLQQQINQTLLANADLQNQLTDFPPEQHSLRHPTKKASITSKEQVAIPESVRVQIKLQVEQAMTYQKEGKPLSISDVIASPDVLYYLFQVAETIDAINADSGDECILTSGDLIRFNTTPTADDSSASMQVAVSKKNSCPVGAQINVGFYDLQEMLNSFNQNLEKNMDKLHNGISK